jgi:hypothetical protein
MFYSDDKCEHLLRRAQAALGLVALVAACAPTRKVKMDISEKTPDAAMDFAPNPDGMRFEAALKLRRTRSELVKAKGWEHESNLNLSPAITWWWYEVDFLPEAVLAGTWPQNRAISLKCRHYLATSEDSHWIGIIVMNPAGKELWLGEFVLRGSRVIDPELDTVIGQEKDLAEILASYRRKRGL